MRTWSIPTFIILLLMSLAQVNCSRDAVTGRKAYNWYSVKEDVQLGQQVINKQLGALQKKDKRYDSVKNKKDLETIQRIVARIGAVSHHPDFPYEVHLAELDVVNAWAAPGGKMMVYEGLWDPKKGLVERGNEDELAAVISHEIAHATARHVTEALSRNMTILLVGQVATSAIGAASAQGGNLFGEMFAYGVNVYIPSYSRQNELEADRIGLIYMAKAGYDPRAAVRLWERAAKRRGDYTTIYSSHPASGYRANELRKHLPEALELYNQAKGK